MRYEHAPAGSYADVASGQVLHSAPTFPAFPARLAVELFEQARHLLGRQQVGLWDPACGAGSLVTTVALLRSEHVNQVLASDVDPAAVALARRNLDLTSPEGLRARAAHLSATGDRVAAAHRLAKGLAEGPAEGPAAGRAMGPVDGPAQGQRGSAAVTPVATRVGRADMTDVGQLARLAPVGIDVVMADLPYGQQTAWTARTEAPADAALAAVQEVLPAHGVVVFVARERRALPAQRAYRSWRVGHRLARLYRQSR